MTADKGNRSGTHRNSEQGNICRGRTSRGRETFGVQGAAPLGGSPGDAVAEEPVLPPNEAATAQQGLYPASECGQLALQVFHPALQGQHLLHLLLQDRSPFPFTRPRLGVPGLPRRTDPLRFHDFPQKGFSSRTIHPDDILPP